MVDKVKTEAPTLILLRAGVNKKEHPIVKALEYSSQLLIATYCTESDFTIAQSPGI